MITILNSLEIDSKLKEERQWKDIYPSQTQRLHPIYEKVRAEERLSFEDGVTLYESTDINGVGYLANIVREQQNGNYAYYNFNQHIDYSNVCILHARCHFCAFARKDIRTDGAWEMSVDEFLEKAMYSIDHGCTEIHSVARAASEATV